MGQPLTKTGTLATALGTLNPFRYRGYVCDEETGFYYLRSRYYNPVWDRFLNADSQLGKPGQLFWHNVFAYCMNNPVTLADPSGNMPALAEVAEPVFDGILTFIAKLTPAISGLITLDALLKGNASAPSFSKIEQDLADIAGGYENLQCEEAANAMVDYL